MNYKTLTAPAIIAVALASSVLIAASDPAGREPVRILIASQSEATFSAKDDVLLRTAWASCSKGLTNDWIENVRINIVLTRADSEVWLLSEDVAAEHWTEAHRCTSCLDPLEWCMWPAQDYWSTEWEYIGHRIADPGEYVMHVRFHLTTTITDGSDWNPDGTRDGDLDFYEGVILDRTIAIHVTE